MMPFLFSFMLVILSWWMFSVKFRSFLYSEWTAKPVTTWNHLSTIIPFLLRQVSPQNVVAQSLFDGELKRLSQRQTFMLVSFQNLSLAVIGVLLLGVLQIEVFLGLLMIGTLLLMAFFKKPIQLIQIAFLMAVFFFAYQWSFYQVSRWIFAPETSGLVFSLADAKIQNGATIFFVVLIFTLLFRIEFWSLWLASLLFFAGGLAHLNIVPILIGESLGWAIYWFFVSLKSSKRNKIIHRESLVVIAIASILYMFLIGELKVLGLFDFRVMGPLIDKKIVFIATWALWPMISTLSLMAWGHFRSSSLIYESTDVVPVQIPKWVVGTGLFSYRGWLNEQLYKRRLDVQSRLDSIQLSQARMGSELPVALAQKSQVEVESLNALLGALPQNSV